MLIFFNDLVFCIPDSNCSLFISLFILISCLCFKCCNHSLLAGLRLDFGRVFGRKCLRSFWVHIWRLKLCLVLSLELKAQYNFILGFKEYRVFPFRFFLLSIQSTYEFFFSEEKLIDHFENVLFYNILILDENTNRCLKIENKKKLRILSKLHIQVDKNVKFCYLSFFFKFG